VLPGDQSVGEAASNEFLKRTAYVGGAWRAHGDARRAVAPRQGGRTGRRSALEAVARLLRPGAQVVDEVDDRRRAALRNDAVLPRAVHEPARLDEPGVGLPDQLPDPFSRGLLGDHLLDDVERLVGGIDLLDGAWRQWRSAALGRVEPTRRAGAAPGQGRRRGRRRGAGLHEGDRPRVFHRGEAVGRAGGTGGPTSSVGT